MCFFVFFVFATASLMFTHIRIWGLFDSVLEEWSVDTKF
jgi:hypothetical protein